MFLLMYLTDVVLRTAAGSSAGGRSHLTWTGLESGGRRL
jgi:hypothetical protein